MGIYLGNTKITGTGVQVDSTLSQTSQHPATNAAITEALTGLGYSAWQKPTDWIDIRSGALPNSVYYLVGHSADYQTYPTFEFYVEAGSTYDVYIDGVKKLSAVASGTRSTINWATLALNTGYDATYPSALRTHIVRITPTDSTKSITRIGDNTASNTARAGLLWVHFTITNAPQIRYLGQNASILEAVTCEGDTMVVTNAYSAFSNAEALKELPIIDGNNASISLYNLFNGASSLKQITLQNATATSGTSTFKGTAIKKITCKNAKIVLQNYTFQNCENLTTLPLLDLSGFTSGTTILQGCTALKDTFLDFTPATGATKLDLGGISSARIDGLKGLLVSSAAPFSGSSPQINASYTGLNRAALVNLFNSLPTVSDTQVCNITGATGASDLTAADLAIATGKGWTITR